MQTSSVGNTSQYIYGHNGRCDTNVFIGGPCFSFVKDARMNVIPRKESLTFDSQ